MSFISDTLRAQGIDPSSRLFQDSPWLPQPRVKVCHCGPAARNRLGGCQPRLRWGEDGQLVSFCATCGKALVKGVHRRRAQTQVIVLAELYNRAPEDVDLEDLRRDTALLVED